MLKISSSRSAIWIAIGIVVPLVAIMAFLRDMSFSEWPAWAVAAAVVIGVAAAILASRRHSMARGMVWLVALVLVALLVIYDVLDAIIDQFVEADWPVAFVAALLVVCLGTVLSVLVSDEE